MSIRPTMQVNRSSIVTARSGMPHKITCWYDCKEKLDGTWKVHYWADYVPSEDWDSVSMTGLLPRIEEHINKWIVTAAEEFLKK